MKNLIKIAAIAAFTLASAPVLAQTANSLSTSGAQAASSSGAASQSNITFNSPARQDIVTSGTSTLRTAPPVQAPSMGSGHPCAFSPFSGSISIIGGGASGGGMTIDEACLLAQMGQGEAALIMIAQRDEEACKALRQTGRIDKNSLCNEAEKRERERARTRISTSGSAAATSGGAVVALKVECRRADGKVTPVVSRKVANAYTSKQIMAACRS